MQTLFFAERKQVRFAFIAKNEGLLPIMPGDQEVWLIGERRATGERKYGERKYYASNRAAGTTLKARAAAVKAGWICEQAQQQLKEERGLDPFEGRSWTGLQPPGDSIQSLRPFLLSQPSRILQSAGQNYPSWWTTCRELFH